MKVAQAFKLIKKTHDFRFKSCQWYSRFFKTSYKPFFQFWGSKFPGQQSKFKIFIRNFLFYYLMLYVKKKKINKNAHKTKNRSPEQFEKWFIAGFGTDRLIYQIEIYNNSTESTFLSKNFNFITFSYGVYIILQQCCRRSF